MNLDPNSVIFYFMDSSLSYSLLDGCYSDYVMPKQQRCMMAIFSNFLADSLEVFMNDFSIFGDNFDNYLAHLTKILKVCIRKRLVLSWDKSHFMVREGVLPGHLVSD